jgi:transcriptional antiterminator NusG
MTTANGLDGAWIAVQVRQNCERSVTSQLARAGYDCFLPLRSRTMRLGARQAPDIPLFPGYVFSRYLGNSPYRIVQASGVLRLVGLANRPIPIPDDEIGAIQRAISSGLPTEPWPTVEVGERVDITAGPLAGVQGTLIAVKDEWRLILSIRLLQRAVAVVVRRDHIAPAIRRAAAMTTSSW